jgi:hypothetical protein
MSEEERARSLEASRTYARGKAHALDVAIGHVFGRPASSASDGAYGPDSERSWFLDCAFANAGDTILREVIPPPNVGSQAEAMQRLASVGRERRDLTTTATAGGNFVPSGSPPSYVAEAFAVGARNAAVLASSLRSEPLPPSGMTVTTGRLTTGGTTVVQASENAATSETDPVTATSSSPVATIAGQVDASQQLFDRSDPGIDRILAEDLGAAWGGAFDLQVLNGTGSNSQLTGLLVLSGTSAITATTATAVANLAAAGKLRADVSTSFGQAPDTLILHPRRAAFIRATLGYAPEWPIPNLVEAPGVPVTLSSTQDALIAIVRDQVILYTAPPAIRVMPDVGSNTLTVRLSAFGYCAMVARQPAAIGKATGAGLAAPSWTL